MGSRHGSVPQHNDPLYFDGDGTLSEDLEALDFNKHQEAHQEDRDGLLEEEKLQEEHLKAELEQF